MIDRVGNECFGCHVCEAICPTKAISFFVSEDGFQYPRILYNKCIECQACEKVCPAIQNIMKSNAYHIDSFAAQYFEKPPQSSSGGLFFAIASYIIKHNGVVYGAMLNDNAVVTHHRVDRLTDLTALCGSKYVQSHISKELIVKIKEDLKSNLEVLVVGTPCQLAGLKLYLKKEYKNIILIDLICHGVPSPRIFQEYIKFCEKLRHKKIIDFIFRDNRDGWNNCFKSTILYKKGNEEYNSALSNLWNRLFFSELITRECCGNCRFTSYKRLGDITLGDFWGIEGVPQKIKNKGVSLILCNEKGYSLLNKINNLFLKDAQTNKYEHPNLYFPTQPNPEKTQFINDWNRYGFEKVIKKYFGFSSWLDLKIRTAYRLKKIKNNLFS